MKEEQNTDILKIIKRLELIKSLILLNEESEIITHLVKLEEQTLTSESKTIVVMLQAKEYNKAIGAITNFINQYNQISFYSDPEIDGLKLEAKVLEAELNQLSDEKAELEKLIHEFGLRHNRELGELILKILRFKKSNAKGTTKESETEKEFNDYSREHEISKDETINKLTEDEQKELKEKYRKASKLCHPDVVTEEQKELADKLFVELNAAYNRNDLQKVREILDNLEGGNFFVKISDAINKKQLLKTEIEKLRLRIKELKEQILFIKESEVFKTISSINDWDTYFNEARQKLTEQVKELESGR